MATKKMALGGLGSGPKQAARGFGAAKPSLPPQVKSAPSTPADVASAYKAFKAQKSGTVGAGRNAAVGAALPLMAGRMKKGGAVKKKATKK